jgi:hypothetical protein
VLNLKNILKEIKKKGKMIDLVVPAVLAVTVPQIFDYYSKNATEEEKLKWHTIISVICLLYIGHSMYSRKESESFKKHINSFLLVYFGVMMKVIAPFFALNVSSSSLSGLLSVIALTDIVFIQENGKVLFLLLKVP